MKLSDNRLIALGTIALPVLTALGMLATGIGYLVRMDFALADVRDRQIHQMTRLDAISGDMAQTRVDVAKIQGQLLAKPNLQAVNEP